MGKRGSITMHRALLSFDARKDLRFFVHLEKDKVKSANNRVHAEVDSWNNARYAAPLPLDAQNGSDRLIMAR